MRETQHLKYITPGAPDSSSKRKGGSVTGGSGVEGHSPECDRKAL